MMSYYVGGELKIGKVSPIGENVSVVVNAIQNAYTILPNYS